jgi:hypothetical protein
MTDKIRIIAIDYPVNLVERLRDEGEVQSLSGNIRYAKPKICLDATMEPQPMYQTLWHEIVHGISSAMNLEIEEKDVDLIATGIVQVLRDNKKVLEKYTPKEWR